VTLYNAAARRVMEAEGIAVDDLYAFALPRLSAIQRPANVHYTDEGSRVLAGEVARVIGETLTRSSRSPKP
jgi:acyl-CoA thioesterase-1